VTKGDNRPTFSLVSTVFCDPDVLMSALLNTGSSATRMGIDLPPDLVERAQRELAETTEIAHASLADLRSQLQALPASEMPERLDDEYLIAFLRPQKFRVAEAKAKVIAYNAYKRKYADALKDMQQSDFDFQSRMQFIPSARDEHGRTVVMMFPLR
jgi:hypothetical protein